MLETVVRKLSILALLVGVLLNPNFIYAKARTLQTETTLFTFTSCTDIGHCIQISSAKAWEGFISAGIATGLAKVQFKHPVENSSFQIDSESIYIDFVQNRIFITGRGGHSDRNYIYNLSSGELLKI